jgi:hypothetical protein
LSSNQIKKIRECCAELGYDLSGFSDEEIDQAVQDIYLTSVKMGVLPKEAAETIYNQWKKNKEIYQ